MGNLVTVEANNFLNAYNSTGMTAPTLPLKLALETVAGTASAAGTEVTGGSYARQTVTFGAATAGAIANSAAVTYTNMPAVTTVAAPIWDSAGTPIRKWFGSLSANKATGAGDTLTFAIGAITASAS